MGDERIDRVYRHVMGNSREAISLDDVAFLSSPANTSSTDERMTELPHF